MALAYFIVAVAVVGGALWGSAVGARTQDVRRAVIAGLVMGFGMAALGAVIALMCMMIWPPAQIAPAG